MIPDPLSDTGHPQAEVIAGTSPGGTTGIVITPGERVADPWTEGHHPPAIGPWKLAARGCGATTWRRPFLSCSW